MVTVVPTSTRATGGFRPGRYPGQDTKVLIDQIRTIDTTYVIGELVDHLSRDDMAKVEHGLSRSPASVRTTGRVGESTQMH